MPGGRGQSLGRFLGAGFLAFGLLLLLAGTQQGLPPALAAGGACLFAGLMLLVVVHRGRAPVAILDGARGEAILCRRRLGARSFRVFPLTALEISADPDSRGVRLRPAENGGAGQEIPGLPSRISDRNWREGMILPTQTGEADEAAAELTRWQRLARQEGAPVPEDACDGGEFALLLGTALPQRLLQWLDGGDDTALPPPQAARRAEVRERPDARPEQTHPEIRRAPDLRDTRGNRDKRE